MHLCRVKLANSNIDQTRPKSAANLTQKVKQRTYGLTPYHITLGTSYHTNDALAA